MDDTRTFCPAIPILPYSLVTRPFVIFVGFTLNRQHVSQIFLQRGSNQSPGSTISSSSHFLAVALQSNTDIPSDHEKMIVGAIAVPATHTHSPPGRLCFPTCVSTDRSPVRSGRDDQSKISLQSNISILRAVGVQYLTFNCLDIQRALAQINHDISICLCIWKTVGRRCCN